MFNCILEWLIDDESWTVDDVMKELEAGFSVCEKVLRQQSNTPLRTQLLAVSAYFGALYAFRRDYHPMLKPMYEYAMCVTTVQYIQH